MDSNRGPQVSEVGGNHSTNQAITMADNSSKFVLQHRRYEPSYSSHKEPHDKDVFDLVNVGTIVDG